ncbi:MAG: hypothetical protein IKL84_04585, partial [Clostridia bacterium]|nr:hypothetical protein [Clostridia bacterium]
MKKISLLCAVLSLLLLLAGCTAEQPPAAADTTEAPVTTIPETAPPTVLASDGQGLYTVIRSEEASADFKELVAAFRNMLDICAEASFAIKTDFYNVWTEEPVFPNPEILVGETTRPESAEVLASLPDNSYAITRRGNKLVIIGTEPRLTEMALQHFTEQILRNPEQCGGGRLLFTDTDDVIVELNVSHVFVCGSETAENVTQSVENFKKKLDVWAKTNFPSKIDTESASGPEILIGETNRQESIDVLAALPDNSYTVTRRGEDIVIIGTEPNLTVMALYHFANTVLQSPNRYRDGKLTFSDADEITVTLDGKPGIADLLSRRITVYADSIPLMFSPGYSDDIRVSQGAASDGTYAYFVVRHVDDKGAVVYKHHLDTGELVAHSEVLQLGHGNDATFDTKNNRLVVAHGLSQ